MSDIATAPDTETAAAPPSGGLGTGVSSDPASSAPQITTDWHTGLEEEYRTYPTIKGIKAENSTQALNALSKQVVNLEKLLGREKWPALKADATSDEQREWKSKYMGLPQEASEYPVGPKVVLGENEDGTPIEQEVPVEQVEWFRQLAFDNQLDPKQADSLFKELIKSRNGETEAQAKAAQATIDHNMAELYSELGYDFKPTMDLANEAYSRIVPESVQELLPPTVTNHPDFIKMFADWGKMTRDDNARGTVIAGTEIQTSTQALQAIQNLEASEDYQKILSGAAEHATKERILELRANLYQQAYPAD